MVFHLITPSKRKNEVTDSPKEPSEQYHHTSSHAVRKKDSCNLVKIKEFITEKGLFSKHVSSLPLMNIATGMVAPTSVDVHRAKQVGHTFLKTLL